MLILGTDGRYHYVGGLPEIAPAITQLQGDVSAGPGVGIQTAVLAPSGVTAGAYGDTTHVPQVTVDAKGRVTAASQVPISGAGLGDVSGPGSATDNDLSLFDGTTGTLIKDSGQTIASVIATAIAGSGDVDGPAGAIDGHLAVFDGPTGKLVKDGGAVPSGSGITQLTGDVTAGPGTGSQAATLANTAATPGTFGSATKSAVLTVDAKGRITGSSETPITAGSGDVTGPAASVDSEGVLFSGTTGKILKRATGTGVVHRTSGVDSVSAVVESDITLANNTTNDVTTGRHGFQPILPNNANQMLDGTGAYRDYLAAIGFPALSVPPAIGGWTWDNQGGATKTDNGRSQTLYSPGAGSGTNLRVLYISASQPYTVTACFRPTLLAKSFHGMGLVFRDSGGQYHAFFVQGDSTPKFQLTSQKFTSATAFSASYANQTWGLNGSMLVYWLRIREDASNRYLDYSGDGYNWINFQTVGRTDFLTANGVGWFVSCENAATPNFDVQTTLISWLKV